MIKFKHKIFLTIKELSNRVDKNWLNMKRDVKKKDRQVLAQSYMEESTKEAAKVDRLIADWTRSGRKHMDPKQAGRIFRILGENFNSLQILIDSTALQKRRCLDVHRKRYKAEIIAGCKTQTNWYKVPDGNALMKSSVLENTQDTKLPIIFMTTPYVNLVEQ